MAKLGLFRRSAPSPASAAEDSVFAPLSPFRIEPAFVAGVWGFRDLRPWYDFAVDLGTQGQPPSDRQPIGEVWLTGDDCRVATGPHTGKRLSDLFSEAGEALIGAVVQDCTSPLLI